jgi:alginate O-acetyltransferase complex protein AlgI
VAALLLVAAAVLAAALAGFVLARWARQPASRALAWLMLVLGTLGVERTCAGEPAGVRMLALIAMALVSMKTVVVTEERSRGLNPMPLGRWLAFAFTWPGMQPRPFAAAPTGPLPGAGSLLGRGALRFLFGGLLVLLARIAWTATQSRWLVSVLLLCGLSFLLHFGLCNLLAGAWRLLGRPVEALFRAPLRSQNLAEFWARRWNLAFSEMTAIAIYRPLSARLGRAPALLSGFVVSGLLHEMAISLPVRAGFGLPLLYFLLHGLLVLAERRLAQAGYPLHGWPGRAWSVFWLVAPLPLLFHRPFLAGIVWPLAGVTPP